jgi:hypothetical protein
VAAEPRSVGRQDIDHLETFSLWAELAIGLAGFTGVASAFGGRDREYATTERVRLDGILLMTGSVLMGSLCVLTLTGAGTSASATYAWASAVSGALQALHLSPRRAYRSYSLVTSSESSTSGWIYWQAIILIATCVFVFAGNIFIWREAWPLYAAFSLQLGWALFLFWRFLTHRN